MMLYVFNESTGWMYADLRLILNLLEVTFMQGIFDKLVILPMSSFIMFCLYIAIEFVDLWMDLILVHSAVMHRFSSYRRNY